ncbi:unnamed protein product [Clavelina lepadiformis]|uniref:Uncharacterized protein n=1 Tax=Clavelina lepadiformis TaxID=159417 RepID=A0ABP0FHM5_CLALP
MSIEGRLFWFLLGLFLFQGFDVKAAPISSNNQQVNNVDEQTEVASTPHDEETISCVMEVIDDLISGNVSALSRDCLNMVTGLEENNPLKPGEVVADVTSQENSDLQSELQDISSQLQKISAQNDVTDDSIDVIKETALNLFEDPDDAEDQDEDETSEDAPDLDTVDTISMDEPLATSQKHMDDDFMVMALKYLKAQMEAGGSFDNNDNAESEIPIDDVHEEPMADTGSDDVAKSMEEAESRGEEQTMRDDDENQVEDLSWNKDQGNTLTQGETDTLHRIELDIKLLDADLHQLEGKLGDE